MIYIILHQICDRNRDKSQILLIERISEILVKKHELIVNSYRVVHYWTHKVSTSYFHFHSSWIHHLHTLQFFCSVGPVNFSYSKNATKFVFWLTRLKCRKSRRSWAISSSIFLTVKLQEDMDLVKSGKSGLTKYVRLLFISWLQVTVTEMYENVNCFCLK